MYQFPIVIDTVYNLNGIYPPVQKYVNHFLKSLPHTIEKVIVFGSATSLRWGQESDLDLLVISDENESVLLKQLSNSLKGIDISIDIIIRSKEQFEKEKTENKNSISSEADTKGVVIYERALSTQKRMTSHGLLTHV